MLSIDLGIGLTSIAVAVRQAGGVTSFSVLGGDGTEYAGQLTVYDGSGTSYTLQTTVLDGSGTSYTLH